MYSWTLGLPHEVKISEAYQMLKKQGERQSLEEEGGRMVWAESKPFSLSCAYTQHIPQSGSAPEAGALRLLAWQRELLVVFVV